MANKKITDLMSGTPVRDSLLESAIDISGTMDSRKVKAGVIADLASANVAAPYDSTVTYAIGQYCLYEGDIYRCIAITTGAFDSTAWTQIVVTGEFRRVVELTSAQYTALSSAEKNNGTLYVITDEETTAADIPYSAGVSVADKLATIPTKYTSGDVITLSGGVGCGQLGYNKVIFYIPLAKQIDTSAVNTCTINLTLTVFGVRNDANVTVISSQSVSLDTAVITENGINLEVNNPNYQNYNSGLCWIKVEGTGTITLGHT